MQTVTFDLLSLEKRLRLRQFRIPQFQRDFTWRESQVKLLIDSISRNYPIGSLLFLPESPDIRLSSRSIDALIAELATTEADESKTEAYYVLDGQQRLTSLARVFLNANPRKNYYFDLKRMFEEFDKDSAVWIIARQRGQSDPERKEGGRYLRSDVVLNQQKTDVFVSEYIEDSKDFPQLKSKNEIRLAAAKIKGIFETIRKYQVPVVILERDAGVESVCRVFETINSTGTRLTTFDLAVARFHPTPDLRGLWEKTLIQYPVLKEFQIDGERLLQVLSLWNAKEKGTFYEPTRASLLSLKHDFIQSNWDSAAEGLAKAFTWAKNDNGARADTLPNHGIMVSIAAFMVLYPDVVNSTFENFLPSLRRWFFSSILQQGARQASNYSIGEDFGMLVEYGEHRAVIKYPEVHLTTDSLIKISRLDNRFKALQCMMAMIAREDLISGKILGEEVEDHHIFPRSLAQKETSLDVDRLDSIANRVAISPETNNQLGNTVPSDYFSKLQRQAKSNGTIPDVNRRLRECLIPGDISDDNFANQFSVENFDKFLLSRANMLLSRVREVVGDSLKIEDDEFVYED
jgi:hypothetical protein